MGDTYVLGLDPSLSCTGGCVFDSCGNPVETFSIRTKSSDSHGIRLKTVADFLFALREKYNITLVVFERGFTRFNNSTQAVFKVMGIANYVFYDLQQLYYPPSTVKKIICGKGNADKKDVFDVVHKRFPDIEFGSNDESDACGVGCAYFLDKGVLK